jgi:hypothetical protein
VEIRDLSSRITTAGRRKLFHLLPHFLHLSPEPSLVRRFLAIVQRHRTDPLVDPVAASLTLKEQNLSPPQLQIGGERPWGFLLRAFTRPRVHRVKGDR